MSKNEECVNPCEPKPMTKEVYICLSSGRGDDLKSLERCERSCLQVAEFIRLEKKRRKAIEIAQDMRANFAAYISTLEGECTAYQVSDLYDYMAKLGKEAFPNPDTGECVSFGKSHMYRSDRNEL